MLFVEFFLPGHLLPLLKVCALLGSATLTSCAFLRHDPAPPATLSQATQPLSLGDSPARLRDTGPVGYTCMYPGPASRSAL